MITNAIQNGSDSEISEGKVFCSSLRLQFQCFHDDIAFSLFPLISHCQSFPICISLSDTSNLDVWNCLWSLLCPRDYRILMGTVDISGAVTLRRLSPDSFRLAKPEPSMRNHKTKLGAECFHTFPASHLISHDAVSDGLMLMAFGKVPSSNYSNW